MTKIKSKVLFVGLDAADYNLIKLWVDEGKLATFRWLIEEGSSGPSKSTIPPQTAMAWASAFTGKNPGKHGMFYFIDLRAYRELKFRSSNDLRSKSVWELLSLKGKENILVNLPLIWYPSEISKDIIIPGQMVPITWRDAPIPENVKEFMHRINYELDISAEEYFKLRHTNPKRLLERLAEVAKKRVKLFAWLIKNYEWDNSGLMLPFLDRVQHFFFIHGAPFSPHFNPLEEKSRYLLDSYQKVDQWLKELTDKCDENTVAIVTSDHGFKSIRKLFLVNKWLESCGLLKFNYHGDKKSPLKKVESWIFKNENIRKIAFSLLTENLIKYMFERVGWKSSGFAPHELDLHITKVYCPANYGFLRANLKGRDPLGIVEQEEIEKLQELITSKLYALVDPQDQKKLVKKVYKANDLYSGPYVDHGPDILFETEDDYFPLSLLLATKEWLIDAPELWRGNHSENGILILHGPTVAKGSDIDNARITDLAPILLYLHRCPIPKDMDGQVLTQAFTKEFQEKHPIVYEEESQLIEKKARYTYARTHSKEEEEIKARLRALGYI